MKAVTPLKCQFLPVYMAQHIQKNSHLHMSYRYLYHNCIMLTLHASCKLINAKGKFLPLALQRRIRENLSYDASPVNGWIGIHGPDNDFEL